MDLSYNEDKEKRKKAASDGGEDDQMLRAGGKHGEVWFWRRCRGHKPTNDGTNIAERHIVEYQGLNIKFPIGYNLIILVIPVFIKKFFTKERSLMQYSSPNQIHQRYILLMKAPHLCAMHYFSNNNIAVQ